MPGELNYCAVEVWKIHAVAGYPLNRIFCTPAKMRAPMRVASSSAT
ncbi:MAG TPA: hypothetical protein VJT81_07345 [Burkholderiales bacterium]|nr:hypothetical protein [Burkholderiales bacterium]